jgi:hypothetical protein
VALIHIDSRWEGAKPLPALALALGLLTALVLLGWSFAGADRTLNPPRVSLAPLSPPPKVEPQRLLPVSAEDARIINARVPFAVRELTPAKPFRYVGDAEARARAIDCLAAAAWYEAGDEPNGERSVIQIVLNRARHPAFPSSICGVVFQGSERRTGCQFTFTCDGSLARLPSDAAWQRARALAEQALDGAVDARVGRATHYHADYVVPYWSNSLDKIAKVGAHIFYRWPGYWGSPRAFQSKGAGKIEPAIDKMALISAVHRPNDATTILGLPTAPAEPKEAAPLPPVIQLAGIRLKSLRGAQVRGQAPDLFFIQVAPDAFPGNYATAALAICKGRPQCTILGWRDPQQMAVAVPLPSGSDRSLTFYYHRDDKGDERALWNCEQVNRTNKAQCLPADTTHLLGLST